MRTLEDILLEQPFFDGLEAELSTAIAGCGRQMRFEAGSYLYRQGDAADLFYLVRRGRVGLELRDAGRRILFHTAHEGDILNPEWIVPPYRSSSDARALDTVLAIGLDGACLRGKCEADHTLGYQLMTRFVPVLVERLTEARFQSLDVYGGAA